MSSFELGKRLAGRAGFGGHRLCFRPLRRAPFCRLPSATLRQAQDRARDRQDKQDNAEAKLLDSRMLDKEGVDSKDEVLQVI